MNDSLEELGVPGFIILKMKADDTEQNRAIHNGFRDFAFVECRNDYTLALGKLLEFYEADAKTEMLWAEVQRLKSEVQELRLRLDEPAKDDSEDTF